MALGPFLKSFTHEKAAIDRTMDMGQRRLTKEIG